MLRTTITRLPISRTIVATRQLHSSPVAGKTVTEKVTEVADKVGRFPGSRTVSLKMPSAGQQVCGERSRKCNRYWGEGSGFHKAHPRFRQAQGDRHDSGSKWNGSGKDEASFPVDGASNRNHKTKT